MQHLVNYIECKDIFEYIDNLNDFSFVKDCIKNALDEYIASCLAQKQYYCDYCCFQGLVDLLKDNKDILYSKDDYKKIMLIYYTIETLSYCTAEYKVLCEKGTCNKFEILFNDKNLVGFTDNFKNIKELLSNYNPEHYEDYINKCEIQIKQLLDLLNVDIEFLKACDNIPNK